MEQLNTCCVCLKSNSTLIAICEADCNDMKWIQKLSSCVPEVSWSDQHLICNQCTEQLEIASTFRKLCLESYTKHQQIWNEDVSDNFGEGVNGLLSMVQKVKEDIDEIPILKNKTQKICKNSQNRIFCKIGETAGSLIERKQSESVLRYLLQSKSDMLDFIPSTSQKSNIREDIVTVIDVEKNEDSFTNMTINKVSGNSELPDELIEHLANLQTNYCKICKIIFKDHLHFTIHNKNVHNLEHPWSYYQTNFSKHKVVQPHEDVYITKNKYKCKVCSIPFNSRTNLISHISYKHASLNESQYQCPHCSVTYLRRNMLKQHVLTSHTHPGGDIICFHCSKGFALKAALLTHLASEHNFKRKKCQLCKNLFGTQYDFNVHLQKEHGINILGRKKYRYKECSRTHSSSDDRNRYRDGAILLHSLN